MRSEVKNATNAQRDMRKGKVFGVERLNASLTYTQQVTQIVEQWGWNWVGIQLGFSRTR